MEIGKFKLAKADLVRPPRKPIQEQIIPKEKPYTKEVFQFEVEPFIKGFIGGFPKNEMTAKLQSILDKAVEKGTLSVDEGTTYMRDRKQQLLDFVKQNPGETLPSLTRENFAIGGGVIKGNDLGTREGFRTPQVRGQYKKYEDGKDYDKLKPATPDEQLKIKEEFNKRYNLFKKGKIGVEELAPKIIAKIVYDLPEVKLASDFTRKTTQFLKTVDLFNDEITPKLKSSYAGLGKKKSNLEYAGQKGVQILRDDELRAEVKKLVEEDKLATRALSQFLQDKYPGQSGLSLTQVKGAVRTLVEEGVIDANKVRPTGGKKLTGEEATERTKILKNLILNTNLSVSDISKKVESPLGGPTSRTVILEAASDLLTDKQMAKRFKTVSDEFINDVKVLDKVIKKSNVQKVINNQDLSKRERFRFLAEEFSKAVNKPIGTVLGQFNDRLTALGSVYSGSKYYDTQSLDKILKDSIKPIKNYNNSDLQKNLIGINSSIKGINNIDMARMIGVSNEDIDILRKSQQASKAAFPGFVLQGDHTDIKSLMSNFDDYKRNFMRIQFIQRDLNLFKSSYDRDMVRLFNLAKQGETIDPKTNLPIMKAVENLKTDFANKTGGYDLGDFSMDKQGNLKINPRTPVISDLDAPINQTLKQTALNLQTYSAPGGEGELLKNKFDQEYLAAETTDERTAVLEKYKDSKVTKGSKILQGLSNVPGPVGRATKTFLAGGAIVSPFVITSIASADTPTQEMPIQETPTQVIPTQEEPVQVTPKQETKEGLPYEAALPAAVYFGKFAKPVAKTALKTVASLPASGYFAYDTIKQGMDEGKSFIDAATEPEVGIELLYPELIKRSGLGFNLLNKLARVSTPTGVGITTGGVLKNRAQSMMEQAEGITQLPAGEAQRKLIEEYAAKDYRGYANGGRIGFADGPEDPSKRKFMKIAGGLASLPIIGRFFDVAQVAEKAAPAVVETFKNAPPHFVGLVNKIRALGKIVEPEKLMPSDQKRYSNVYDYGDYRMYEGKDGQIEIAKDRFMATDYGDAKVSEEYMSYNPKSPKIKKGELTGETEPQYDEYTAYADQDGKMKDVVNGIEPSTKMDGTYSKEELEQLIIEQVEQNLKKGKK